MKQGTRRTIYGLEAPFDDNISQSLYSLHGCVGVTAACLLIDVVDMIGFAFRFVMVVLFPACVMSNSIPAYPFRPRFIQQICGQFWSRRSKLWN